MNLSIVAGRSDIMDLTDLSKQREKWERVLMGGGTFSCSPLSMVAGLAMIRHLKENARFLYSDLEKKGQKLRDELKRAFDEYDFPVSISGIGSLVGFHYAGQTPKEVLDDGELAEWVRINEFEVELKLQMINRGVYTSFHGGVISAAHTQDDIEKIVEAARKSAEVMAQNLIG